MFGRSKVKVDRASLETGHLYWVQDGVAHDAGSVSAEDLKILAYVTEEARVRMPQRKRAPISTLTLSRANALAQRLYRLTPKK